MAIYKYSDPNKKQRQVEYATYMIFSSYFKKALCKNTFPEKKLLLYYKELGDKAQVEMEESVIFVVENKLNEKISIDYLENLEVDVLIKNLKNGNHSFTFKNTNFLLEVTPVLEGTAIQYYITLKENINGKKKNETIHLFSHIKKKSNEQWQQSQKKVVVEIEDEENF